MRKRRSKKRLVIFDCDNFLTMGWEEGRTYMEKYAGVLAQSCGIPEHELHELLDRTAELVNAAPNAYGMRDHAGRIVAPTRMDAYVYMRVLAGIALDTLRVYRESARERENLLHHVHEQCYDPKPVFRSGAKELVEYWSKHRGVGLHIVTGSHTANVERKMEILLGRPVVKGFVVGSAGKHKLTLRNDTQLTDVECRQFEPMWQTVRESFPFPGAGYDAYPQRGHYYHVLTTLLSHYDQHRVPFVAGDSLHCDGLLPLELGMNYIHLVTEHTPQWEMNFMTDTRTRRGYLAENLSMVGWYLSQLI